MSAFLQHLNECTDEHHDHDHDHDRIAHFRLCHNSTIYFEIDELREFEIALAGRHKSIGAVGGRNLVVHFSAVSPSAERPGIAASLAM